MSPIDSATTYVRLRSPAAPVAATPAAASAAARVNCVGKPEQRSTSASAAVRGESDRAAASAAGARSAGAGSSAAGGDGAGTPRSGGIMRGTLSHPPRAHFRTFHYI